MNSNALFDAKTQYHHLLRNRLADVIYDAFLTMYQRAEELHGGETLVAFQTIVKDVQNWNMKTVEDAVVRTESHCGDRFINQCLKAIFYLNAKILSGFESQPRDIQLRIPPIKDFIYDVFLETARTLYRNPTLMVMDVHRMSSDHIEKNVEAIYTIVFRAIDRAVDKSFPYEDFLKGYDEDTPTPAVLSEVPPVAVPDDQFVQNEPDHGGTSDDDDKDDEVEALRHIPFDGTPMSDGDVVPSKPVLHSDAEDGDTDTE